MRTAIVSDLHLGAGSGEDVLRDGGVRAALFEEIAGADRVLLLGDVVELRGLPLASPWSAPAHSRGAGAGARRSRGDRSPATTTTASPSRCSTRSHSTAPGHSAWSIAMALRPHRPPSTPGSGRHGCRVSPGLWLRDDVYATHGHYLDAHLSLPRAECVAAAARMRTSGPLPQPGHAGELRARPAAPLQLFLRRRPGPSGSRPCRALSPRPLRGSLATPLRRRQRRRPATEAGGRGGAGRVPGRDLGAQPPAPLQLRSRDLGDSDPSGGVEAAAAMATRLQVDGVHVITGHTHRGGPNPGEAQWPLPGGGQLHNTGSWATSIFHHPGTPPSPYWPGTVTWVEDSGPPRTSSCCWSARTGR